MGKRILNCQFNKYLLLVIIIVLPHFTCSRVPEKQPGMKPYVFKTIGLNKLKLYVFEPTIQEDKGNVPAIVFFHGGGFTGGKVSQFERQCKYLASRGMVTVLAEYRLVNWCNITHFECVEDAKSAIRWVRVHSDELGVDKDRIVAGGGSAGGHLAACTALINGYDDVNEDPNVSSVPNALVLFNPVLNFPESCKKAASIYQNSGFNKATEISPMHNVHKGAPPTIIFHGTADESVPFSHAIEFCEEMKKYGNNCELVPFEGGKHGFFNYQYGELNFNTTMEKTINFLSFIGYLKGDPIIK